MIGYIYIRIIDQTLFELGKKLKKHKSYCKNRQNRKIDTKKELTHA